MTWSDESSSVASAVSRSFLLPTPRVHRLTVALEFREAFVGSAIDVSGDATTRHLL